MAYKDFFVPAYENPPEVEEMPCYPDKGAIRLIDDVLIVKF